MGSLFGNMTKRGSYGVVPGNGNPKADDKKMNAGPGHVVPHENVDAAKKVVSALGYDPNQKVSMNQGGGSGMDINISSKEYFLNQEQVDRMQNELGIDPETLSPNSPYNKRVKGGTTKQVEDMVDQKLYGLMMNNNNQYPSYQNGGGTGEPPLEFVSALMQKMYGDNEVSEGGVEGAHILAGKEWPKYLEGTSDYQFIEMDPSIMSQYQNTSTTPTSEKVAEGAAMGTLGGSAIASGSPDPTRNLAPGTFESFENIDMSQYPGLNENQITDIQNRLNTGAYGVDFSGYTEDQPNYYTYKLGSVADPNYAAELPMKPVEQLPDDVFTNRNNYPGGRFPKYHELYDPELDAEPKDPTDPRDTSKFEEQSPEEKALAGLMERSEALTEREQLANAGMGLWNLSRQYKDLPDPIRVRPSSTKMDYETMKEDAEQDVSKQARLAHYINKQMGGSPVGTTGISANQMDAQNKIASSLWTMQNQQLNQDRAREDQYNSTWISQKLQRDMQNEAARSAFAADKGNKIAGNVREIFDAEEAGLYRDQGLINEKSSMDMDIAYMDYKSLDKAKMMAGKDPNNPKSGYLSFSDYMKMTEDERRQLGELYSS